MNGEFTLPVTYDLIATVLFAATGALLAVKKGYDVLGMALIAIISGGGGGIIRDAVFLNIQPAFITNWRYITAVLIGGGLVIVARSLFKTTFVGNLIMLVDALSIGMYGVFATQKSLMFGLGVFAAAVVGVVAATGGGLIRDVLLRQDPRNLLPGQLYGILAVVGVLIFLIVDIYFGANSHVAAWIAIITIFITRLLAIKFNWRTRAVIEMSDPSELLVNQMRPLPSTFKSAQYKNKYRSTIKKENEKPPKS